MDVWECFVDNYDYLRFHPMAFDEIGPFTIFIANEDGVLNIVVCDDGGNVIDSVECNDFLSAHEALDEIMEIYGDSSDTIEDDLDEIIFSREDELFSDFDRFACTVTDDFLDDDTERAIMEEVLNVFAAYGVTIHRPCMIDGTFVEYPYEYERRVS